SSKSASPPAPPSRPTVGQATLARRASPTNRTPSAPWPRISSCPGVHRIARRTRRPHAARHRRRYQTRNLQDDDLGGSKGISLPSTPTMRFEPLKIDLSIL